MLEALALLGGVVSPFHYLVNDLTGASFVIEFHQGEIEVKGLDGPGGGAATEFTCWTSISDLDRKLFFLLAYDACNYTRCDLSSLAGADKPLISSFQQFHGDAPEGTTVLKAA